MPLVSPSGEFMDRDQWLPGGIMASIQRIESCYVGLAVLTHRTLIRGRRYAKNSIIILYTL